MSGRGHVPLAAVVRSGFIESVHTGTAVVVDASGTVLWSIGDPDDGVYGRSANKPLQAQAMLRMGLQLSEPQIAIACASHSGLAEHTSVVRDLLGSAGLDDHALQNTPDLPMDSDASIAWVAGGHLKESIVQNCSGKHAAMLATCVANGWDTDHYLDPHHPLQVGLTDWIADATGGVVHVGIDGCGAPTHATSLTGLARAFSTLAGGGGVIASAMSTYPELVAGPGREATRLMNDVPGLIAKDGADGVFAGATADGLGIAIKIGDGATRAAGMAFARAAQFAGILVDADPADYSPPVLGHGETVGRVEPLF